MAGDSAEGEGRIEGAGKVVDEKGAVGSRGLVLQAVMFGCLGWKEKVIWGRDESKERMTTVATAERLYKQSVQHACYASVYGMIWYTARQRHGVPKM